MRGPVCLAFAFLTVVAGDPRPAIPAGPPGPAVPELPAYLEAVGKTQCVATRRSVIQPVVNHPVEEVLVRPGDRVKKGQELIKIDSDEPRADLRAKEATLENARVTLKEARRHLEATEKLFKTGALSEQKYYEVRVAVLKAEADERVAVAGVDSAKAELEHYTLTAMIDGVVGELSVHPGTVPYLGRTVYGEVLDLSEVDVRVELTPEDADRVEAGQSAEVRRKGNKECFGIGRVVYVGLKADETSGLVPAHVRVANPDLRLRCNVAVQVRFVEALPAGK